jgi:hypothetical protein
MRWQDNSSDAEVRFSPVQQENLRTLNRTSSNAFTASGSRPVRVRTSNASENLLGKWYMHSGGGRVRSSDKSEQEYMQIRATSAPKQEHLQATTDI